MTPWDGVRRVFRLPRSAPGQQERDVDDEIAFHLAMRERRLRAGGLDAASARTEAHRRFGDADDVRSACLAAARQAGWRERLATQLASARYDARAAARSLRRAPGFAACASLLLALGIGGTTLVFSVVNAIALRPLPYPHAERLAVASVALDEPGCGRRCVREPTLAEADAWARSVRSAELVGTLQLRQGTARAGDGTMVLEGAAVSASLVRMLAPRVVLGRMLDAGDFAPDAAGAIVLGHAAWRSLFGGDPAVVGRVVTLHDRQSNADVPHRVVGVLAPEAELGPPVFSLNAHTAQYLAPQRTAAGTPGDASVGRLLVRARPGVTLERLRSELDAVLQRSDDAALPGGPPVWRAEVAPLRSMLTARYRGSFWLLLAAVAAVLCVTCINVAGLVLARLEDRMPELATRTALGATRFQLVRQMVLETSLVAAAGGAGGMLLAHLGLRLTRLIPADRLPFWTEVRLDARVALVAILTTAGVALLLAVAPLALVQPRHLLGRLRELVNGSPARLRTRGAIVAFEVAFSVVLLVSAGLFVRLLATAERRDVGYARHSVLYVSLGRPRAPLGDDAALRWTRDALARLAALPGVVGVGVGGDGVGPRRAPRGVDAPDAGPAGEAAAMRRSARGDARAAMMVEGRAEPLPTGVAPSSATPVTPGYFAAKGTPLLRGRDFASADDAGAPPVAVIDEPTARRLFPGSSAIGRRVRLGGPASEEPWLTIVGVVAGTIADPLEAEARYAPALFRPIAQAPSTPASVLVHVAGDAPAMTPTVRRALQQGGDDLPVASVIAIEDGLGRRLWEARFSTAVLGAFALLAVALTCLGVYAVVRYMVGCRRREIAVRLAIGATPARVAATMLGAGLRPVVLGLGVGLLASLAATRLLRSMLHGATATDPLVLAAAAIALLAVAAAAAGVPVRRAAREDPARALRAS